MISLSVRSGKAVAVGQLARGRASAEQVTAAMVCDKCEKKLGSVRDGAGARADAGLVGARAPSGRTPLDSARVAHNPIDAQATWGGWLGLTASKPTCRHGAI